MDFPYSIFSDQYDLFMNKIIEEMLPINSYNQFKSIKQLQSIRQSCAHHIFIYASLIKVMPH